MYLWGLVLIRSSGKGKKQASLHYTAAQLLEKGVLVEIEDLPASQYVSPGLAEREIWVNDPVEGKEELRPSLKVL